MQSLPSAKRSRQAKCSRVELLKKKLDIFVPLWTNRKLSIAFGLGISSTGSTTSRACTSSGLITITVV